MESETYTPGHSKNAMAFMAQRTLETHGRFFRASLEPGHHLLDAGCGPGTITIGLAEHVESVIAVDFSNSQVAAARSLAADRGLSNVRFETANCYQLPFADGSFDRIFSHALIEHLARPLDAFGEFLRVLRPGGMIGVCCPDFSGRLLAPASSALHDACETYASLQASNGGDLCAGKKLGDYAHQAGFQDIILSARYENYDSLTVIGEYLALQLEQAGNPQHAATFRDWSQCEHGMFAQAWVSVVARKTAAD